MNEQDKRIADRDRLIDDVMRRAEGGDGMKVYVVIHEDRHTDPRAYVYANADAAVAKAKDLTSEYDGEVYDVPGMLWCMGDDDGNWAFVYETEVQ